MVDAFTLRSARARAERYTPEQNARLRRLFEAGREWLHVGRDLRDATRIGPAAAVYREALVIAARGALLARQSEGADEALDPAAIWARWLVALEESGGPSDDRRGQKRRALEQARDLLANPDILAWHEEKPVHALKKLDAVHEALAFTLGEIEPRSPAELRRARIVRIGLAVLALLGAVAASVVYLRTPNNVALGKPAHAHSYWPGSATAEALVNGQIESPWGSASARTKDVWFAIDLLEPHEIDRVVVYNRGDVGARESTPFAIELSEDGRQYRELSRAAGRASPGERWSFEAHRQVSRYVRIRKLDARGIALSEIEVYGFER